MLELAHNLNAELGFSPISYDIEACTEGAIKLRLTGLTPSSDFVVLTTCGSSG